MLLVDHEDSFVHTLGNYLRQTGAEVSDFHHILFFCFAFLRGSDSIGIYVHIYRVGFRWVDLVCGFGLWIWVVDFDWEIWLMDRFVLFRFRLPQRVPIRYRGGFVWWIWLLNLVVRFGCLIWLVDLVDELVGGFGWQWIVFLCFAFAFLNGSDSVARWIWMVDLVGGFGW